MSRYPQNTYVGMRYVPLFDGDWNSEKDYEPLTVVNLDGNSYTSKTFVPAGMNPVGNTDYWAETGNYNAQIEAYRQEVLQYNGRIQANADAITALDAREDTDIQKIEKTKLDDIWSGTVIMIGDSYLEGYTPSGNVKSWGEFVKEKKKIEDSRYIAKFKGGVGFKRTVDGVNFSTLFDSALIGIDPNTVTLVIIAGGYNDGADDTSSYIIALAKKCKERCKNCEVYIGYCGYGADEQDCYMKGAGYEYPQSCIAGGGHNLGNLAEILKMYNSTAMNGYHPNARGSELLADSIINIIDGGEVFDYSIPFLQLAYVGGNKLDKSFISIDRGHLSITIFGQQTILYNGEGKLNNTEFVKLTLNSDKVNFHGYQYMTDVLNGFCKTSESKYYPCTINVLSTNDNNVLSLRATALAPDGNGYLGNVTEITILPGTVVAPLGLV